MFSCVYKILLFVIHLKELNAYYTTVIHSVHKQCTIVKMTIWHTMKYSIYFYVCYYHSIWDNIDVTWTRGYLAIMTPKEDYNGYSQFFLLRFDDDGMRYLCTKLYTD